MVSKDEVWAVVEPIAKEIGVELFDIEVPAGSSGALRVYLWRSATAAEDSRSNGVGIQDCATLSKRLIDLENFEAFLPGSCVLEVSSPGINRKLSRDEHFQGAVGERVRLVVRGDEARGEVLRGTLTSVTPEMLVVLDEECDEAREIAREAVKEARVDFKFD